MALVQISRGAEVKHNYVDGVSRVPILEGAYHDATVERISIKPGADLTQEIFSRQEHNQVFLITSCKVYIVTPLQLFNITEVTVFVPVFYNDPLTFDLVSEDNHNLLTSHSVTSL